MKAITRAELIILAGLSATVYPEGINKDGAMHRLHGPKVIEYVERKGVRITRAHGGGLRVAVGGTGERTQ